MEKNIEDIKKILPHRYPFLLLDKVKEIEIGKSCNAIKNVTYNESLFQGHFPQRSIYPGVLIIEALAQTSGIIIHSSLKNINEESMFFFAGINKAKFRSPVIPGDQLLLFSNVINKKKNFWVFDCKAKVNDKIVAQAEIRLMQ